MDQTTTKPSGANHVRNLSYRKDGLSLKAAARAAAKVGDELATNWLHNKSVSGKRKPKATAAAPRVEAPPAQKGKGRKR